MKIKMIILLMMGMTLFSCSDLLDIESNVDIKDKDTSNTGGRDTTGSGGRDTVITEPSSGFIANLTVFDSKQNTVELKFGLHKDATIGTGMYAQIGTLDTELGETELPPLPPPGSFDARWIIPTTNGTLVNIFPFNRSGIGYVEEYYRLQLQLASDDYDYQYFIKWNMDDIPSPNDTDKNPDGRKFYLIDGYSGGSLLNIDMKTGYMLNGIVDFKIYKSGSEITLMVFYTTNSNLTSFSILCES